MGKAAAVNWFLGWMTIKIPEQIMSESLTL
jgi:hypothetical protein